MLNLSVMMTVLMAEELKNISQMSKYVVFSYPHILTFFHSNGVDNLTDLFIKCC